MTITKFSSITGVSLSHAKKGETVKISYRLNCKDEIQGLDKFVIARNNLEDLIYPEIMKRVKRGQLSPKFKLRKAHVLMFSNELRNSILLNGRTKFLVEVKLNEGANVNQSIGEDQIKDVLGIYPKAQVDPNAAHIMLFKFKGNWLISYDFIYNSKRARNNIEIAKKEVKDSMKLYQGRKFMSFVQKQCRAVKLCIQSILALNNSKLSFRTNSALLEQLFFAYATNKNIDVKFSEHFKKLLDLRNKGVHKVNKYFENSEESRYILNMTNDLIEHSEKILNAVNFYRNPPSGIYIDK